MGEDLSLTEAVAIVNAAIDKAMQLGISENICVVDVGGNLKAFARMDGAWIGSIDISLRKAKTARFFDMPTAALGQMSKPDGPLRGIEFSNEGLITFGGGIPVKNAAGVVIGAVGVSGSTVENDIQCAQAGIEALGLAQTQTKESQPASRI